MRILAIARGVGDRDVVHRHRSALHDQRLRLRDGQWAAQAVGENSHGSFALTSDGRAHLTILRQQDDEGEAAEITQDNLLVPMSRVAEAFDAMAIMLGPAE